MNINCDSSTPMTDAPAISTEDVDREMGVMQAPGEHGIDTDVCVVAMDLSANTAKTPGRREISYENVNSFPCLEISVSSADRYADHGTSLTYVSNVPVETVVNDGSLDDPEWILLEGVVKDFCWNTWKIWK